MEDSPTELPDPGQLRAQAKELKRALDEGSAEARGRVLASHPKFAGRPPERMQGRRFGLRDAQATMAREYGYDSWMSLLEAVEGDQVVRWGAIEWSGILSRAFKEARQLGHGFCTTEHILLALLSPPEPTIAGEVLTELGLSHDALAEHADRLAASSRSEDGVGSTPVYQLISGMAQGIAIGMGSTQLIDEHVLLAICYDEHAAEGPLMTFGIDPDDIVAGLRDRRVSVPEVGPPVAKTPIGPLGPWVYFPQGDFQLVTQAVVKQYPPGTVHWGTNRSKWKPGHWYVHGEDEIPMEQIVKSAVPDPDAIIVLAFEEGSERELAAPEEE